MVQRVRAALA